MGFYAKHVLPHLIDLAMRNQGYDSPACGMWMAAEVAVAFVAAIRAHSVALAAFGGDSAIELMSAAVVLARFRSPLWITEQFASKITGWLLVTLAGYITAQSLYTLIAAESKPEPSYVGIGLLWPRLAAIQARRAEFSPQFS